MKTLMPEEINSHSGRRLAAHDTFMFRCGSDLPCFNRCCRNLNLYLHPFDVLRLKQRLNISSSRFLDELTDVVLRPTNYFPEVLLTMSENAEKTCPFLTQAGCSVYADRPDTCRMFPLEYGVLSIECFWQDKKQPPQTVYWFRPPDFCLGVHEQNTWSPETWSADQDAQLYNTMTKRWGEVKRYFINDPWGQEGPQSSKGKMAFMAAYNIDEFRNFVFHSSFLKRYRISADKINSMRSSDLSLLELAFEWILYIVWNEKPRLFSVPK